MEVIKCFVSLLFIFKAVDDAHGRTAAAADCTLALNKDFSSPAPVYFLNGAYLTPNPRTGDVTLQQTDTLLIACPGSKGRVVLNNVTQEMSVIEVNCVSNTTFRAHRWLGQFRDVRCNVQPQHVAEETREVCWGGNRVYRVGYRVRNKFHTLYLVCFDTGRLRTVYVKHHLTPSSQHLQTGSRPQFTEGNLFGKIRMSDIYKVENQRSQLNTILGEGMDHTYLTKNQYLTRGHLAPRADFSLRAAQRATFHYVNTAPQWRRGNAGDWAALEDGLRRRVHAYNATVTVYTGTYGVVTLESRDSRHEELYLATDANNNNIVPVPLYFFKLVYDHRRKTAIAFVSINSSYYNSTAVRQLSFCTDICYGNMHYSWLRWRSDGTHSFCCDYDEFVEKIDVLPRLHVQGLFF